MDILNTDNIDVIKSPKKIPINRLRRIIRIICKQPIFCGSFSTFGYLCIKYKAKNSCKGTKIK